MMANREIHTSTPMIELVDVTKKFGDFTAVDHLNLVVPAGELFCFLGPNGAGKTTTIKLLCGLLKPTSGTIRVAGSEVSRDNSYVRSVTGYVPDFPFLYERLTGEEFFHFCGALHGVDGYELESRKAYLFNLLGLQDYKDILVQDFSHGMRQRLIYAVTLLHDPKVIFVDEPFIGLDPYSIRLIKRILRDEVTRGKTVFLTTHILALIEDIADRIGIIDKGRLVAVGTLEELRSKRGSPDARLEDIFFSLTE